MAKIIFISDLHFSSSKHEDVYDQEHVSAGLTASLSENIYDLLFSALESEKEPSDVLIFCGDYVMGRESDEEKRQAMKYFVDFLKRVEKSKKILKGNKKNEKIIIVPGNHDILRGAEEIYQSFRNNLSRYRTPFTDTLDCPDAPTFIFKKSKLLIDCEATEDNSSTNNAKVQSWIDKINSSSASKEEKEELIKELEKEKTSDIPSVPASISTRFINTANKLALEGKYSDYTKIMVTHHPLISGIEAGKTIKSYNNTIGGFDFMRAAMGYGYTLFIHGHIHERTCIELTDFGRDKPHTSVQLGVPNLIRDREDNGIVVIDTDRADGRNWPFSIIYKTLSSYTRTFNQSRALEGEKMEKTEKASENDNMKILVDTDIAELIDEGKIIKNGDRDRVEAASYDCALGYEYKKSVSRYCDWGKIQESKLEVSDGVASEVTINPNETVLIYTYEEFDVPKDMVMHASPISAWLRKGLQVEISYFVDPGFKGQFCFPVVNVSDEPISISSREPIMSIELIRLSKQCDRSWSERHADKAEARIKRKD